jgi:hypothetical protein
MLQRKVSAFRPRGVPGPTSKLLLRVPAQMGRREMEHKGEQKRDPRLVLSCAQGGCACSRGLQAFAREGERERVRAYPSARSPARPPSPTRDLDLPFIDVRRRPRCTMGSVEPYVHADVAVGEVLVPCSCDVVAVGGALEPYRSTVVGAVVSLLTSPCFHKGLRTTVVMEHAGCHHYLFTRASQMGRRCCSP